MHYLDKQAIKQLRSSLLIITGLAIVILILSQIHDQNPQVKQVLGAFTQK